MTRAMPEPLATETDDEYRARLRRWFDATSDGTNTAGLRQAEWEYLCSLAGIAPQ